MRRSLAWVAPILALAAAIAHGASLDVDLAKVHPAVARGDSVVIEATLFNPGTDSVYVNGVENDLAAELGADSAAAVFLALGPVALAAGESWEGPLLVVHANLTAAMGLQTFHVGLAGGANEIDSLGVGTAWFTLEVADSGAVLGVSPNGSSRGPWKMSVTPSPFASRTSVRFTLHEAQDVAVRVYDLTGRQVRQLLAAPRPAGEHTVEWNGRDDAGQNVPAGVYFIRVLSRSAPLHTKVVRIQ